MKMILDVTKDTLDFRIDKKQILVNWEAVVWVIHKIDVDVVPQDLKDLVSVWLMTIPKINYMDIQMINKYHLIREENFITHNRFVKNYLIERELNSLLNINDDLNEKLFHQETQAKNINEELAKNKKIIKRIYKYFDEIIKISNDAVSQTIKIRGKENSSIETSLINIKNQCNDTEHKIDVLSQNDRKKLRVDNLKKSLSKTRKLLDNIIQEVVKNGSELKNSIKKLKDLKKNIYEIEDDEEEDEEEIQKRALEKENAIKKEWTINYFETLYPGIFQNESTNNEERNNSDDDSELSEESVNFKQSNISSEDEDDI
jgi:hypothetical protein